MSSTKGTLIVRCVLVLIVAAGVYLAWPTILGFFQKPKAPHLEATPTIRVSDGLIRSTGYLAKSAELRDKLIEKAKTTPGFEPELHEWLSLEPKDSAAVKEALKPKSNPVSPFSPGTLPIPKDKLVFPDVVASQDALRAILRRSSNISMAAAEQGKTYSLEELIAIAQPAVPMIVVKHAVECEIIHTVSVEQAKNTKETIKVPVSTSYKTTVITGSSGSGFFIDANGHIVTNWHVIAAPKFQEVAIQALKQIENQTKKADGVVKGKILNTTTEITLTISGRYRAFAKTLPAVGPAEAEQTFTIPAKLIGSDEASDLAVLKVNGCTFPYLSFANEFGMKVGQTVTTVGYPNGNAIPGPASASDGVIAGLNRSPRELPAADLIQHSAFINLGNSGGPLLNRSGQVVGVNTYRYIAEGEVVQGTFFSRGPRTAAPFVNQIIHHGHVVRPLVKMRFVPDTGVNPANTSVLVVTSALEGSAVQKGDILLQLNGRTVTTVDEWIDALGLMEKDRPNSVRIVLKRAPEAVRRQFENNEISAQNFLKAAWQTREIEVETPLIWP